MRKTVAATARLALACGVFGFLGFGLSSAYADDAACKGIADAMLTNSKTPYHSVGTISFDASNPPGPNGQPLPKQITTETIFTGKQVFVKLPSGDWKDIHIALEDLQSRVRTSANGFNDCQKLGNDKIDGKDLAVYTGSNKTDTMNVVTKIWVTPETGALVRSETIMSGPSAPDGKIRTQHVALNYDYKDVKAPANAQ